MFTTCHAAFATLRRQPGLSGGIELDGSRGSMAAGWAVARGAVAGGSHPAANPEAGTFERPMNAYSHAISSKLDCLRTSLSPRREACT
jgi:hypothetical protein